MNEKELEILDFIKEHFQSAFGDIIMPLVSKLGDAGIIWIALAVILLLFPKTRKIGCAVVISLLIESIVCNGMLKPFISRIRPFSLNPKIHLLVAKPTDFSFPSGHTGASFASASVFYFKRKRGWISLTILASLIAFSRLYLYVHYPTDVLGGVLLGNLSGYLSWNLLPLFKKMKYKIRRRLRKL